MMTFKIVTAVDIDFDGIKEVFPDILYDKVWGLVNDASDEFYDLPEDFQKNIVEQVIKKLLDEYKTL